MPGLDEAQWIAHYETLEKPLYNVVYRVIWDAAESQDVVQEAFLRCWRKRGEIRAEGFKALIFKTALNLAINRRRRGRLRRFVGLAAAEHETARADGCETLIPRRVRAALDALPERFKLPLLLAELAGMTYAEIATTLGIREGTVGSRRNRALAMLRRELEIERGDDDEP